MTLREILRINLDLFFKVLGSAVVLLFVYNALFYPEIQFAVSSLAKLILLALICCALTFILYSNKELNRAQMRIRFILHGVSLAVIMPSLLFFWEWLPLTLGNVILVVVLVLLVYALIMLSMYIRFKSVTDQLNAIIKRNNQ